MLHSYVVTFMPILPSGATLAKVFLPIDAAPLLEGPAGADWKVCLKKHDALSETRGSTMRAALAHVTGGGLPRAYVDAATAQWTLDFRG